MKTLIALLCLMIFSNSVYSQYNGFFAPLNYSPSTFCQNDSLFIYKDGKAPQLWFTIDSSRPFDFVVVEENDTIVDIKLGKNGRLKKIKTTLYKAEYIYRLNQLTRIEINLNKDGYQELGLEYGSLKHAEYIYSNNRLSRIDLFTESGKIAFETFNIVRQ